jgi:predicted nucleotidyltransferase
MKTMQATSLRKDVYNTLEAIASSGEPIEIMKHNRSVAILSPSTPKPKGKRKPLLDLDAIAAFCKRHQIKSFSLFGSILRDDFNEKSDVDVLLDVQNRSLEFRSECQMIDELEAMFGRKVDILPSHALTSPLMNEHRKKAISSTARLIYNEYDFFKNGSRASIVEDK